jgi:hypothetical protein
MDNNLDLHLDLTADASELESSANVSTETLDKIAAAIVQLTAGIEPLNATFAKLTGASTESSAGLDKAAGSAAATTESLRALGAQTGMAARGFEALGIGASESAARVEALSGALAGMLSAAPGLLALGAVLSTGFAGFSFLKEGVKDASDAESALRELSLSAAAAGQSTLGMTDKVEKWAEAMAEAAGISESQTIPAILRLVDAGQSVGGAMTIATVAGQMVEAGMGRMRGSTDMAESAQARYNQVLLAFYGAMDGNYTMISRIDPAVRKLVEAHAPLPVIIAAINEQTQDSIEKNNTNSMAWDRLHGIISVTAKDIGSDLLPMLTDTARYLYGVEATLGDVGKAFIDWASNSMQAVGNVLAGLEHLGHAMFDLQNANFKDMFEQAGVSWNHFAGAGKNVGGIFHDMQRTATDFFQAGSTGAAHLANQLRIIHQQGQDVSDVFSPAYKSTGKKGGGSRGYNAPASSYEQPASVWNDEAQAQKDLTSTTTALDDAKMRALMTETKLEAAVKLATTSQGAASIQQALYAAKAADAQEQVTKLTAAIAEETSKRDSLSQAVANSKQTLDADTAARKEYESHLSGKETETERQRVNELTAAQSDAKKQLDDLTKALKAYDDAIKAHNQELASASRAAILAAADEGAGIASLQRKWEDFTEKQVTDQQDADAKRRLSGKSLLDYYLQNYQQDYALFEYYLGQKLTYWAGVYEQKAEQELKDYNTEAQQIYQADYNNYKQIIDKMANEATQFVDKVFLEHKSLRTELKLVWQEIYQDFADMLNKMLEAAMQSGLEKLVSQLLGGSGVSLTQWQNTPGTGNYVANSGNGGPLGQNAIASAVSGAGSYGVLGALLGTQGASQVVSAISTSEGAGAARDSVTGNGGSLTINMPSAAKVANAAGGSGLGSAASSGPHAAASALGGTSGSGAGAQPLASAYTGGESWGSAYNSANSLLSAFGGSAASAGTAASGAGASAAAGSGTTLLSSLKIGGVGVGTLLAGALGGETIANMLDHGNQDAQIGGAVGGAAGTLLGSLIGKLLFTGGAAAGPVGMIIGSLLGALAGTALGSLFGDHFPKANEPDIYQTQQWGQELADLQGSTAGNPMIANGQDFVMDSSTSSQTQGKGWNILIESFVQKFRNNQKALPTELQGGFAMLEELWGGAQNQADFNGNGKNGMLQIGSGTMSEYSTFWGYVSAYGPAIAQLMAMYSPTDLYAASMNGSVKEMGGYTPSGDPFLLHAFPDAGSPGMLSDGGALAPSVPGGRHATPFTVNVYNQFGGSLIAETAVNDRIKKAISTIPVFSQLDLNST